MNKQGFSLVELAIVLVILGLLTGGVLTGQSLIRAAELRSVSTDYSRYITAVQSFRDKYFALPGDMQNATLFWGAAHATPATCVTTASTTSLTCNGDGDGRIDVNAGSNERFRFWQHLANAALIEGRYSGITQGATDFSTTTANAPTGKISNSLWYTAYWGTASGYTYAFDGEYGNILEFGITNADADPVNPAMSPDELWNLDTKVDDGKPAIGKLVVRTRINVLSQCTNTVANNPATLSADYLLTSTSKTCAVIFRNVF